MATLKRKIIVPENSSMTEKEYEEFLNNAYELLSRNPHFLTTGEDVNCLELAHLIPDIPEAVIAIYVGINDAVCSKGFVAPVLIRHGHNNVFAFENEIFSGASDVPAGTVDAREILNGFEPPNNTWDPGWTYVMAKDPERTFESLWHERGYIDMIAAKFEDFTMLGDMETSKACFFIDHRAFEHPVNKSREYLKDARKLGEKMANEFEIPKGIEGEFDGLAPVILDKGQKLYVARTDFGACEHGYSNIHPDNEHFAVVNEVSAIPLDLVIAKPPVAEKYLSNLVPPKGSADMTTDYFYRGLKVFRRPLLEGLFKG